jgi:hypothetical protein
MIAGTHVGNARRLLRGVIECIERGGSMGPFRWNYRENIGLNVKLGIAMLLGISATAQDVKLHVTYVCNGERIFVEDCNIRDLSDSSTCMVGHPDRPTRNGIMAYTNETRGALKQLFPTCKQPTPQELAAADAFKKKQQEIYDANVAKANPQANPQPNSQSNAGRPPASGQASQVAAARVVPPKNAEERAMRRCVSSGRLPATCTGNSLLGAFGQMVAQVLPSVAKEPAPGPELAGVFEGAGQWRLDFIDGGVLVNCSFLSPDQHGYSVAFRNNRAFLTIDTTPKPPVLTLGADGKTMAGPGPVVIDGVVASGYDTGYRDQSGRAISANEAATSSGPVYDSNGNRVNGAVNGLAGHATFSHKQATCPALNLSTKGASVGVQTMQTDLLKAMFNDGDKGPPTPPGIRMHGIFAASTGFSVQFFPESVILGCGPDAARAYPYTVIADGTRSGIKIDAPDHPLTLAFGLNGSLDPGSGPYQVHGRIVVGMNANDDFTFAPLEQTCNLAVLAPSKTIPSGGGAAAAVASAAPSGTSGAPGTPGAAGVGAPGTPAASGTVNSGGLSTPAAPLGNATLSVVSGFRPQAGAPNPLAGRPYVLLRDSYANALAKGGVSVPPGISPYKYVGTACANRTPDCQKTTDAIKANAASAVRADVNGNGTFPGVAPGTYYLMISALFNNQSLVWGQAVQLKPGPNSITLDQSNAVPIN